MKRVFVFVALSLVVFSSGCTVPGLDIEIPFLPDIFGGMNVQEQRHDVISIEKLDAIPSSTVRSGQSIRLRAVVKNLQSPEYKPVDNVEITLYNDCGMFEVTGDFCSDRFEKKDGILTCKVKMYPQSTSLVQWKLDAKEINVETPCKIGIMAKYSYTTYSTASVTFVNKAELERLVAEGKSFSETGTLSIGEGPVKPYVEVLNQPIVIDKDATGEIINKGSGIMSFWLENKGSGIIGLKPANDGNVYFGVNCNEMTDEKSDKGTKICLKISGAQISDNDESKGIRAIIGNGLKNLEECITEHMKVGTSGTTYGTNFIGKATPKYPCSITVGDTSRIKQESTYQIKAEVGYFYKFTKEISITVQPKIKL